MKWLGKSAGRGRTRDKTLSVLHVPRGITAHTSKFVVTGSFLTASIVAAPTLLQRRSSSLPDAPGGVPSFAGASIPSEHITIIHPPESITVTKPSTAARAVHTFDSAAIVISISHQGPRSAPAAVAVTAITSVPAPRSSRIFLASVAIAAIIITAVMIPDLVGSGTVIAAADMVIHPSDFHALPSAGGSSPRVPLVAVADGGVVDAMSYPDDTGGGDNGRSGPSDDGEAAAAIRTTILAPVHGTSWPPPAMFSFLILLPSLPLPDDAHGGYSSIGDEVSSLLRDDGVISTATSSASIGGRRSISGRPRVGYSHCCIRLLLLSLTAEPAQATCNHICRRAAGAAPVAPVVLPRATPVVLLTSSTLPQHRKRTDIVRASKSRGA